MVIRFEWTDNALNELRATYKYLEDNWSKKEIKSLSSEIERIINLISNNPRIFPVSETNNIRKTVIKKLNTVYYRVMNNDRVEILSFFSNRQDPNKRKI